MENQLTTDQKITIANMAKELVISVIDNKLLNSNIVDPKGDADRRHCTIDNLFDYFYDKIIKKIKE
ncbi:hypothetical protein LV777_10315 [Providencia rettgeri]|uniref:hypothetical protein n=1 Tax=Providencia rettgeri TaxID=587 RepID=UPI00206CC9BD|nr:hypothetical protein [Providencia rettgeri]UPQ37737.1 hypothetical protein LV777_10315 [Providencia rettgeri]